VEGIFPAGPGPVTIVLVLMGLIDDDVLQVGEEFCPGFYFFNLREASKQASKQINKEANKQRSEGNERNDGAPWVE
jgi:hypothetical protein